MKINRWIVGGLFFGLLSGLALAQVNRSVQLSQDGTGPLGYDFTGKHLHSSVGNGGASPVLTACGTTPSIVGTDFAGTVTMGTTSTGCVITFATAYSGVPNCVLNWQGTPLAAQNWTVTATAITTVQTSASNNLLNYICVGR